MMTMHNSLSEHTRASGEQWPAVVWLEKPEPIARRRRVTQAELDRRDAAEADRRLSDPKKKLLKYGAARKELGLA